VHAGRAGEVEADRPDPHGDAAFVGAVVDMLDLLQAGPAAGSAGHVVQEVAHDARRRGDRDPMLKLHDVSPRTRSSARRVNTTAISRLYPDVPRKSSSGST